MLTCAAKAPGCRPGLGAIVPADGTPAAGGWSRIFLPGESGKAPRDGGGCEKNAYICFESLVSRSRGDSPATRREQAMHDVWILRVWIIPINTGGINFCHFPFWQKFPSTFGIYDTTGKEHQQLGKKTVILIFWCFLCTSYCNIIWQRTCVATWYLGLTKKSNHHKWKCLWSMLIVTKAHSQNVDVQTLSTFTLKK